MSTEYRAPKDMSKKELESLAHLIIQLDQLGPEENLERQVELVAEVQTLIRTKEVVDAVVAKAAEEAEAAEEESTLTEAAADSANAAA